VSRPADVHRRGALRIVLGPVDVGPGRRVQHELGHFDGRSGKRDVPVRVREADSVGKLLRQSAAELAACPGDQDPPASRSDRIGDVVLQRSTTRGSSHGS
jgi:hypothetical protein